MRSPFPSRTLHLAAALLAWLGAGLVAADAKDIVIHAGRLLDGIDSRPQTEVSIVVHDDRIVAVTPGFVTPAGAEIIDLSQATVMPVSSIATSISPRCCRASRTPPNTG